MDFKSIDITPGEHLAIVGPNGSGKSMLVESLRRRHPYDIEYISFRDTYGDEADGAYYYQLRWNRQELANLVELESDAKEIVDTFVNRPHKTLLFVTHFDEELPDSIDHTLVLKKH